MAAETIKEFLVSIGWQQNDAQYAKFAGMLEGATLRAKLLGDGLEEVARKVYESVSAVSADFEKLYYQSIRTGQSAASIKEFTFAASQLGSSVDKAAGSLEAMGATMAKQRDGVYEGYLNNLGFTYDKLNKKVEYNQALAEKAAKMPFWQEKQWADALGLDDDTLRAMRKVAEFQARIDERRKSMAAAGLDPEKASADAVKFANAQRALLADLGDEYDSVVMKMSRPLTDGLNGLDSWLKTHEADINSTLGQIGASFDKLVAKIPSTSPLHGNHALLYRPHVFARQHLFNPASGAEADAQLAKSTVNVDESKKSYIGQAIDWLFGPAKAPGSGASRGLSIGGKSIDLQRADDGGADGTALGGATRSIEINGTKVGPGNPLPVTLDNYGFGGGDSSSSGGIFGAISAGVRRVFGGGGGGGGDGGGSSSGSPGAAVGGWWTPERMKYAASYLQEHAGLSATGAAGLVARWAAIESSGGPGSVNPRSGAVGIAQGLGSRRAGYLGDFDSQLANAARELNGSEKRAGDALRAASSAADGARGASMFERAEGYNSRTGMDNFTSRTPVQRVLDAMNGTPQSIIVGGANSPQIEGTGFGKGYRGDAMHNAYSAVTGRFDIPSAWRAAGDTNHNVVNHKTEIHVDGSMDPEITARMVAAHVHRTNQDLTRNMTGAAQ